MECKKAGAGSKPAQIPETAEFTDIPTLDKVQEHIERVRVIMGQSPTTPGRNGLRESVFNF